jgi:hypothetical protein
MILGVAGFVVMLDFGVVLVGVGLLVVGWGVFGGRVVRLFG